MQRIVSKLLLPHYDDGSESLDGHHLYTCIYRPLFFQPKGELFPELFGANNTQPGLLPTLIRL